MNVKKIFATVAFILFIALCTETSSRAEERELKAVCFLPKNHRIAAMSVDYVKRLNKAFAGRLKVKYIGGPEITASKEQIHALKNGLFDINFNVTSYYSPLAPELNAFQLSKLMPWEERRPGGFYDYMRERHKKIDVTYVGRWVYGSFYIWTKKPVSKVDDLDGLKLRAGPMYIYFMKKLGVSSVSIKPTDVYTALERGTVDGFAWPILGARDLGWTDSCKYLIDNPFYGMDGVIIFNRETWNGLPEKLRGEIEALTAKFEEEMVAYFTKEISDERELLKKAGVRFIKFTEDEDRRYVEMAYDAYWDHIQGKVPDLMTDLKRITTK